MGRRVNTPGSFFICHLFYLLPMPEHSSALPPALISAEHLTISRGRAVLLKNIDWVVRPGEHWAVLGGNGAGKSTLLQAALGLIWPDQIGGGRMVWHLDGRDEKSPLAVRGVSAIISPRTQAWYAHNAGDLSGEELLLCGLYGTPRIYRAVSEPDRDLARGLAAAFNLSPLLEISLEAMSQGQLRRMLIASACLAGPRILALDEAADGLDAAGREALFALLGKLAAGGFAVKGALAASTGPAQPGGPITMLMAAHREEDLPPFISHALYLEAGRVGKQGPVEPQELLVSEKTNPTLEPRRASAAGSDPLSAAPAKSVSAAARPVLELCNISVFLGRRPVLRNLNWRVDPGEHWAVVGPNGSGKTTLLRLLWGEIPAALGGELRWFGRSGPFNIAALRRKMGLVSDRVHQTVPPDMPTEDVVLSGFFGSIGLYEEPAPEMYPAAADILQDLELEHLSGRLFGTLSFGEARRVLLARALVHKPALLLLDEALSGLDAKSRAAFLRDLSLAAQNRAAQIIQVSHHPDDFIAEIDRTLYLEALP